MANTYSNIERLPRLGFEDEHEVFDANYNSAMPLTFIYNERRVFIWHHQMPGTNLEVHNHHHRGENDIKLNALFRHATVDNAKWYSIPSDIDVLMLVSLLEKLTSGGNDEDNEERIPQRLP